VVGVERDGGIYRGKARMPRVWEFWPTGNGRVGVNIGRLASGRGLLGRLWW